MFHLIWGNTFLQPHSVCFSSAVNAVNMTKRNIDVPTELFNNTGSFHLLQTCTEFSHHGFTYPEPHQAIISYDCSKMAGSSSFTMRMISFIKGYSKDTVIFFIHCSFHYISSSYCFGSGCLVSDNQSAGSQFYTSKVTDHYNKDIRQLIGIYLPQNRLSCSTRGSPLSFALKSFLSCPSI